MLKNDIQMYGEQPEMIACHIEIKDVFDKHCIDCVTTSVVGKKHKKHSLHPVGFARDYRTKHIKSKAFGATRVQRIASLMADLRISVPQCDFVFEHLGKLQEHIHAEYDPKNDPGFQRDKAAYRKSGSWVRG